MQVLTLYNSAEICILYVSLRDIPQDGEWEDSEVQAQGDCHPNFE